MRKYGFTGEKKFYNGTTLNRIIALRSFGDVKFGDIGGWIEKEENLSHFDNAWVYDDAIVCDEAYVGGNATVSENAIVCNDTTVSENAKISGDAIVDEGAVVSGSATVSECAYIYGEARIYGDAKISGNSRIYGTQKISGSAKIKNTQDIISITPIGSESGTLTAYRTEDGNVEVIRGCFRGSLEKFEEAVEKRHGDNRYGREYRTVIRLIEARFGI